MVQPSHLDLLAASRQLLYVAITERDATALVAAAERLRAELVSHIEAERGELAALPPRAVVATDHGQQATLTLLDALLADLCGGDGALEAAMNPAAGPWRFYVRAVADDSLGRPQHEFFADNTSADYNRAVQACMASSLGC